MYRDVQIFIVTKQGVQNPIQGDPTNLCKKVPGKKFLEKKPGNKNFGKKSEFYQVLGKNVTVNKVLCFGFLGLFFLICQ